MAIFRVTPTEDYTLISNHHLKNKNLSLDAKGLLSQILSIPKGWDRSLSSLSQFNHESAEKIQKIISELESAGYLTKDIHNNSGMAEFIVHERPK